MGILKCHVSFQGCNSQVNLAMPCISHTSLQPATFNFSDRPASAVQGTVDLHVVHGAFPSMAHDFYTTWSLGRDKNTSFLFPYHPWDWYIYLHEWFIFMVNVGKYTIHGWYGLNFWKSRTAASNVAAHANFPPTSKGWKILSCTAFAYFSTPDTNKQSWSKVG